MLDLNGAGRVLENWAKWSRSMQGRAGCTASLYMSPEERLQAGATCGLKSVNEEEAVRADAILAIVPESMRVLIKRHHLLRDDPVWTCRRLRLPLVDYRHYVTRAETVFLDRWNEMLLTPTKMIRYLALNNSTTLRRDSTRKRVVSHA
ncbi:hypothetical protein [Chitiniphilus eburneus]|uniref:hypothetical protein n=1 Tax=Chitiniphilus eburneus TaxID=2571148 RepID=UPI0035D09171